jgi:hypothetical protein
MNYPALEYGSTRTVKKRFVLSHRITGRKRLMTIGSYGKYTGDEGRKHFCL